MADVNEAAGADKPWRQVAKETLLALKEKLETDVRELEAKLGEEGENDTESFYPTSSGVYRTIVTSYLLLQAVLSGLAFYLLSTTVSIGIPVNIGILLMVALILHLANSLRAVGVNDLAGISLFGRPICKATPGLYLLPLGLFTLVKADRNYKDERFPGPANKIYRVSKDLQKSIPGGDMPSEEKGQVRPFFVTTGEPKFAKTGEAKPDERNPLDAQQSIEISYFLRYRPNQQYGGIFRIIRNLSTKVGVGDDLDKAIKDLIREQSERDIKAVLTLLTPATIIENWDLVNEVFILKTRLATLRLGIDIGGGGLDDLNASHETNDAQADAIRAKFNKQKVITTAEGERQKKILEGEGVGKAEQARLEGIAAGYKKIKDDLGVDGATVIGSETAKDALGKANTIVVGTDGVSQLLGMAKAAAEAFKKP